MPDQLDEFPTNFNLHVGGDPANPVVATASISGDPAVATFTLTDYVNNNNNVCGDAFLETKWQDNAVAGTTQELEWQVNGTVAANQTVTVRPRQVVNRDISRKVGAWGDDTDQCRTNTTNCLQWIVETPAGPLSSVTVTDVAATGTTFDCPTLGFRFWPLDPNGRPVNPSHRRRSGGTTRRNRRTCVCHYQHG